MTYYLRRLLELLGILAIVSLLVFSLLHVAPGDPASVVAGTDATPEQVEAVRESMGLNQTFIEQFLQWIVGVVQGDFGVSYVTGQPVAELVFQRAGSTLQLVFSALVLMVVLSASAGAVLATAKVHGLRDIVDSVTTFALAVPPFVSSIILIFTLSVLWPVLPAGGQVDFLDDPAESMRFLLLPALAIALPNAAILARLLATELRRSMQEEFVLTARAKGASQNRIVWRHAIPTSLNAYIVQLGITFGNLIGGAVVVEALFARAGIGGLLVESVTSRDYPTAQAVLLLTVGAAILAQMCSELTTAQLDPRVKVGGAT